MIAVREADILGFGEDFEAEMIAFAAGTGALVPTERLTQMRTFWL